jgi:hypothetical protein
MLQAERLQNCGTNFKFGHVSGIGTTVLVLLMMLLAIKTQLVETLCYKPEGRGFESRSGGFFFSPIFLILPVAL